MGTVKILLMYILAIFTVALVGNIFLPLAIPLRNLIRKIKSIQPIIWALLDFGSTFISVLVIVWLCGKLNVKPTLLMVIIPGILMIHNNNQRIMRAKKGISKVQLMLESSGEPDSYDQTWDIRNEYAHQIGSVTGLLCGTIYFLHDASLF